MSGYRGTTADAGLLESVPMIVVFAKKPIGIFMA
jgi:hypothetical protein